VGREEELYQEKTVVQQLHWVSGAAGIPGDYAVQIRSTHKAAPAALNPTDKGAIVRFATPQKALTPGQYAAFYHGDELIGSGVIQPRAEDPS
jgi:tRNA-specific 2-thiouridylase